MHIMIITSNATQMALFTIAVVNIRHPRVMKLTAKFASQNTLGQYAVTWAASTELF